MSKVYVLLREINAYDQEGAYFAGVYSTLEKATEQVTHLGRKECEYDWYTVEQIEIDEGKW